MFEVHLSLPTIDCSLKRWCLKIFSILDPSLCRLFKVLLKGLVTVYLILLFPHLFPPLHSEHFISPCHLSFLSVFYLFSTRGSYSIHQNHYSKTLAFKSLTVPAFLSDGLDLSISFLSHFATLSLSLLLFSLSIFFLFFGLSSIHLSSFLSLLHIMPRTSQLCLSLLPSLFTLCYFDLPLLASDKQPVWWVLVYVCIFLGMSPLH